MDYPLNLDLGELVPGAGVVVRGVRLDGAALTLFFEIRPARGAGAAGRRPVPARARFICRYQPGGPVDDGVANRPGLAALVEATGRRCRVTFPPPVDRSHRVRFELRPPPGELGRGRSGGTGGLLCLDLGSGCAVYLPLTGAGAGPRS
ncbi:hypothetical protein UG55_1005342 [Frankia sp. EI5c]|uniref:hypothetical protein n=1 Tax=Frankia sp. EI5c TaxID=683316 RepID=UPI0007C35BF5|nr:hypothetical protein [Frankia sp. EI5c]OAA28820.1 hypothetical protein UG55_1005342 [Frankia sp. EI5c]